MPLIKASETIDLSSTSHTAEYVESNASNIIDRARDDATRIIATAIDSVRSEVDQIRESARLEGFEAGREEGYQQGLSEGRAHGEKTMIAELQALRQTWFDLLSQWERTERERRDQASIQAMQLAIAFAERIIHRKVEQDPEVVVDQLRHALDLAQTPSDLEILVSESDRERVHQALPGLLEKFESAGYVSIQTSDSMSAGGCVLRMRGGEIDSSIELQLERLVAAMIPEIGADHPISVQFEEEAA